MSAGHRRARRACGERATGKRQGVHNVLTAIYRVLGIDPATTLADHSGRLQNLLDDREPVRNCSSQELNVMYRTRWKIAASVLAIGSLAASLMAAGPPGASPAAVPDGSLDEFSYLDAQIKPRPGGFDDIPWMTSLWEARKKAATEGKPLLVWAGEGNPIGFT